MMATVDVLNSQTQASTEGKILRMLEACGTGNIQEVQKLLTGDPSLACLQNEETGQSPLMVAAATGQVPLTQLLLEAGAPWNAVDRKGYCAGNYATDAEHWEVVNLLVEWGTRAELILGAAQRVQTAATGCSDTNNNNANNNRQQPPLAASHQPSTKPDYLQHPLRYNADMTALLDADNDAVMMQWERPLMKAHAQILMEPIATTTPTNNTATTAAAGGGGPSGYKKRVMNIGFGMGIIDTALQELEPSLHIIVEAHPDVYQHMLARNWDQKPHVRICFGKWQDVLPQLIQQGVVVDAIFFDTYAENQADMEDFHQTMVHLLSKPHGIYSFFNGLAPDNLVRRKTFWSIFERCPFSPHLFVMFLNPQTQHHHQFFHGVACQCVKLQLAQLGLDSEFLPCQIQVDDSVWDGVRRKYWHGRDTYYLPRVTWKLQALQTPLVAEQHDGKNKASPAKQDGEMMDMEVDSKRQKIL